VKIDEYGCLIMEHVDWPGSIGDSAAESGRYEHLKMLLGDYVNICNLEKFVTPEGYVRHPTAPDGWREGDFSTDQALGLYLAWRRGANYTRTAQMERRIKRNWYRTGNNDIVSPGFFAELMDSQVLRTTFLLIQLLLFMLPYRWNDETKSLERMEGSSADYLNFIHCLAYAPKFIRKLVNKETLTQKVKHYYRNEPNAFVVDLYVKVINDVI
jgi:hypothetical protein